MLWFFESFFPVVWIAFFVYWQIRAAGAKTTQHIEPAASRILRALAFLIVIVLLSTTRLPLRWLLPPALAAWPLALLDWSCSYRRRPSLRRLGAPASRQQLEPLGNH